MRATVCRSFSKTTLNLQDVAQYWHLHAAEPPQSRDNRQNRLIQIAPMIRSLPQTHALLQLTEHSTAVLPGQGPRLVQHATPTHNEREHTRTGLRVEPHVPRAAPERWGKRWGGSTGHPGSPPRATGTAGRENLYCGEFGTLRQATVAARATLNARHACR
jgi:hypothetical protein